MTAELPKRTRQILWLFKTCYVLPTKRLKQPPIRQDEKRVDLPCMSYAISSLGLACIVDRLSADQHPFHTASGDIERMCGQDDDVGILAFL